MRLLEKRVVKLGIIEKTSDSTIRRVLKKRAQAAPEPLLGDPAQGQCRLVAAMEEVLEVDTRPRDPDCPLVCLDQTSKQLTRETRAPLPVQPGHAAWFSYEYERNGVASL